MFQDAVRNRYGFGYTSQPNPVQDLYPEPKPLYRSDNIDSVAEHKAWCLARCIGAEAAKRLPIPASSIPIYAANEAFILNIN